MTDHSYHNTTAETNDQLDMFERGAKTQDEKVYNHIRGSGRQRFTAEDIHTLVLPTAPLTSSRRALSNLQRAGLIEQCGKVKGCYHRNIFYWRLKQ